QYGHSARLIPGRALSPRFRCRLLISTLQRWFTRVRLPGPRLTALTPPFPQRSAPQSSARAPCGGLTPPPAGRRRRATKPSSHMQQASVIASYRKRLLSAHTAQKAVKLSGGWGVDADLGRPVVAGDGVGFSFCEVVVWRPRLTTRGQVRWRRGGLGRSRISAM